MGRIEGKVAVVTGGSRGMGAATVRLFVEQGAKVVIADVLDEEGQALADELGEAAVFQHLDVSQEAEWSAAVATAQSLGSYNVLVNNAGIVTVAAITDTSVEEFTRIFQVNQLGMFLGIRSAIEPMKDAGGGSIINISSIEGFRSQPGLSAYSSTKWAARGLTKNAAMELGQYGIRVNSVHPGAVYTLMGGAAGNSEEYLNEHTYNMLPIPRIGRAHEIAYVSLFLASDEGSYTTGAEITADGGWSICVRSPDMPCS